MKTVTRQSAFETNSSSTHSITINKNNVLFDSITPDALGTISLFGGEFGWEWEIYDDPITKANYCAVDALGDEEHTEMLIRVIKLHTGAKEVKILASGDYEHVNRSYIDHQSKGTSLEAFSDDDTLKNFIFNRRSKLFTGNDNDDSPCNFYDEDTDTMSHVVGLEGTSEVHYIHGEDKNNREKITDILSQLFLKNIWYKHGPNSELWSSENGRRDGGFELAGENTFMFDGQKVRLVRQEHKYNSDGEFIRSDTVEEKFIDFTIKNRTI